MLKYPCEAGAPERSTDTLIIGVGGYTSGIKTVLVPSVLGAEVDASTAPKARLREWGLNPYLIYFSDAFDVLLEGVYSQIHDRIGNQPKNHVSFAGFTGEVALNLMENKLHPYIRYDMTRLPTPETDPYFGLREDGGMIMRHFVGEYDAIMVGASYDLSPHARLKSEVVRHFGGPREEWGLRAQIAFGF